MNGFRKITIILVVIHLFMLGQSYGQTTPLNKGSRAALDQLTGYGIFIFDKKITDFKGIKSVPTPEEVVKVYVYNSPVIYPEFKADSVQLYFFGKKLYAFEFFINQSQFEKAKAQFITAYGNYSKLPALEGIYHWKGKIISLDISSIDNENKVYAIRFENLKGRAKMEAAAAKKDDDLSWLTEEPKKKTTKKS